MNRLSDYSRGRVDVMFRRHFLRSAKKALLLGIVLSFLGNTLPATACVCPDGTIKFFCPGKSGGGKCCCCSSDSACSGCCCRSKVAPKCKAYPRNNRIAAASAVKGCCCHRIFRDQSALLSGVSSDEESSRVAVYCDIATSGHASSNFADAFSTATMANPHLPFRDSVILFRRLII